MARRRNGDAGIMVKVARTGTKVAEVALNGGRSVADALDAAGITKKDSEEITVNGQEVETDHELEDGDRVLLVKNVEGGRS